MLLAISLREWAGQYNDKHAFMDEMVFMHHWHTLCVFQCERHFWTHLIFVQLICEWSYLKTRNHTHGTRYCDVWSCISRTKDCLNESQALDWFATEIFWNYYRFIWAFAMPTFDKVFTNFRGPHTPIKGYKKHKFPEGTTCRYAISMCDVGINSKPFISYQLYRAHIYK